MIALETEDGLTPVRSQRQEFFADEDRIQAVG